MAASLNTSPQARARRRGGTSCARFTRTQEHRTATSRRGWCLNSGSVSEFESGSVLISQEDKQDREAAKGQPCSNPCYRESSTKAALEEPVTLKTGHRAWQFQECVASESNGTEFEARKTIPRNSRISLIALAICSLAFANPIAQQNSSAPTLRMVDCVALD